MVVIPHARGSALRALIDSYRKGEGSRSLVTVIVARRVPTLRVFGEPRLLKEEFLATGYQSTSSIGKEYM